MPNTPPESYRVLARKYRPETFADLVGQDAMVRTLKNAFAGGRIAHAFILTGIRGTGKTTTARIIAKGLNCIGPDGSGGPTTEPCGQCEHCVAIAEGRHVDVMEMDAASRTGVGDIREIIDSVHYRAASARYKIYIIDEVHMLSTSAFNALLKTLEEPPEHVKFIFATTEIRKVPVTVLSRCQRFDLRRMEPETTMAHLRRIAEREGAEIEDGALALITRAAEGSMRDAISLLDQAIAHGAGATTAEQVRAMLGLADRGRVLDLFELVMKGDVAGALGELAAQYADGADPLSILRDLAEVTHWVSVIQITPDAAQDPTIGPDERARGQGLAERLPMRVLTRAWQMLLKAIDEVGTAPNAMMAAEMAIIRLTHVADLPTPGELVARLAGSPPSPTGSGPGGGQASPPAGSGGHAPASQAGPAASGGAHGGTQGTAPPRAPGTAQATAAAAAPATEAALARFPRFASVVELVRANRDMALLLDVERYVRLVSYAPGRIEFSPAPGAPVDLGPRLARRLQQWTGVRWGVSVVAEGGAPSIAEARQAEEEALRAEVERHPAIARVREVFPGARIVAIRTPEEIAAEAAREALAEAEPAGAADMPADELDDDWDPFEDG